ncbi:unnamed protein product [Staurois parvus]|uniref:Uncharacterized protein n=1 Tax=Staurois parvus TaxID=386267 RepID=A0ABN9AFZ8_9NEOB|nr:unnamed protein product [Staurois parvus]
MTPGIQDRRSGTVQSPYIQNKANTENDTRHPGQGEVGLCRVHTYRIRGDTENDPGIQDRRSGTVQSPYIQNKRRYRE